MKSFKEFLLEDRGLEEGIVRGGASLAFAANGRKHGDAAVRSYNAAKQAFAGYARKEGGAKLETIAIAINHLLDGLISTRHQIGSLSGQLTLK